MNTFEEAEVRTIDLRDLFFTVLKSWKTAIACGLILAIVLGGVGAFQGLNKNREIDRDALMEELSYQEQLQVEQAVSYYKAAKTTELQMMEDPIMSMDPYSITETVMLYYISADSVTDASGQSVIRSYNSDLQAAYRSYGNSNEIRSALAEMTGIPETQIDTYYTVSSSGDSSLEVTVISENEELGEKMCVYLDEMLMSYTSTLGENIGVHTIQKINQYTTDGYNKTVDTEKNTRLTSYNSMVSQLEKLAAALDTTQEKIYNSDVRQYLIEIGEEESDQSDFIDKKMIVIGFAAGFILLLAWVCIKYILDGKVKVAQDIEGQFPGASVICLHLLKKDTKKELWLDRRLDAWHKGAKAARDPRDAVSDVAVELAQSCKKNGISELVLSGTCDPSITTENRSLLAEELKKNGLAVRMYENTASRDFLEALSDAEGVLLYEVEKCTEFAKLEAISKLCDSQKVNVFGIVLES